MRVRRFRTVPARGADYPDLSAHALGGRSTRPEQLAWLRAHGPHAPDLVEEVARQWPSYDALFFVTYLSEATVLGAQVARERAVLIPTAHDEPPLRLPIMGDLFDAPELLYEGGPDLDLGEYGRRDPSALPDFDADRR